MQITVPRSGRQLIVKLPATMRAGRPSRPDAAASQVSRDGGPVRQPASRLRRGTRCSARPGSAARHRPAARARSRRSGRTVVELAGTLGSEPGHETPAAVTAAPAKTPLQIRRPRRGPGPAAFTAKTPKFALEISTADMELPPVEADRDAAGWSAAAHGSVRSPTRG